MLFLGTIFCYGQSSSGKTFTMSGTKMQPGVVRLSVEEIFNIISSVSSHPCIIQRFFGLENEKFYRICFLFIHILAENIYSGYLLEPPCQLSTSLMDNNH